jgi:hypothetical protein
MTSAAPACESSASTWSTCAASSVVRISWSITTRGCAADARDREQLLLPQREHALPLH